MKHVFHIHSYTCYITSVGVLRTEEIKKEEAVFFIYRNLPKIIEGIEHVFVSDEDYYFPFFTNKKLLSLDFLKVKSCINMYDNLINERINEPYIYYVHNSRSYLYRVFITHTNCEEVRFIEDGLDMYFTRAAFYKKYPFTVRFRHKIVNYILGNMLGRNKVYQRLKQQNDPFLNKKEIPKFYGLTEHSFKKFLPERSNFTKIESDVIRDVQNYTIKTGSNVFVFSALIEQFVTSQKNLDELLEWFVKRFKINSLFINFHPHQSVTSRKKIVDLLEAKNVELNIISDNVIMEAFFMNNKCLNIFGVGTSLLLYATYFSPSSKVHVLYPYFKRDLNIDTIRTKFWANTYESMEMDNLLLYGRDFD